MTKNNVKKIRTAAGLTQEELATMIGSSKQYISSLERGERNINQIRADTMQRLCSALNCNSDDLIIIKSEFECDDEGKLIVDKLYYDPRISSGIVAEINNEYFLIPSIPAFKSSVPAKEQIRRTLSNIAESACELQQYMYVYYNCIPRDGFKVEVGRAITDTEFKEIRSRFNLTENEISEKFVDSVGNIYGGKYSKSYNAVQIKVPNSEAVGLEQELKSKGIQADNIAPERVNIRVK